MVGIGCQNLELATGSGLDSVTMHQPGNRVFTTIVAVFEQEPVHSRATVIVQSGRFVHTPDFFDNPFLLLSRLRLFTFEPLVIAGS